MGLFFDAIGRIDRVHRACDSLPSAGTVDAWRAGINLPRLAAGLFIFQGHLGGNAPPRSAHGGGLKIFSKINWLGDLDSNQD